MAASIVDAPGTLVTAGLLDQVAVTTLRNNNPVETSGGGLLLNLNVLNLLGSNSPAYLYFSNTQPFDGLKIITTGLLGVAVNMDVYSACVSLP